MSFINAIKKTGFLKFKSRKCKRLYLEFSPFPPHFYRPLYPSLLRRPTPPIFQDLPTSEEAKKRKEKERKRKCATCPVTPFLLLVLRLAQLQKGRKGAICRFVTLKRAICRRRRHFDFAEKKKGKNEWFFPFFGGEFAMCVPGVSATPLKGKVSKFFLKKTVWPDLSLIKNV